MKENVRWARIIERCVYAAIVAAIVVAAVHLLFFLKPWLLDLLGFKETTAEQAIVSIIGALLTFVVIVLAAGYFIINSRLKKIEKVEEIETTLRSTLSLSIDVVLQQLPPVHITQHIPYESFCIFCTVDSILTDEQHRLNLPKRHQEPYVRGLVNHCRGHWREAAKLLEEAAGKAERKEERAIILWRLGITYRQFEEFGKSGSKFDDMLELAKPYSELWSLALKGEALTLYAQYKSDNKYETLVWGTRNNRGSASLLIKANDYIEKLLSHGFDDPQLTLFYGALIKEEIKAIGMDAGPTKSEDLFRDTYDQSLVNGRLYPYQNDHAILADFYFSLAICCKYLGKEDEQKKYATLAEHYARLVDKDYGSDEYDFIYSEQYLKEVRALIFIEDIIKSRLLK
jgi:tetratricopeptide (TPR) repeat protein